MSGMAIPPFPSLDLAKLVLGYLAEEQLMTAYDEFLQASPYLDALRNEYDRIFMTSLKNILAEYRAVKIYVETCKPFALRKRLFQCTNLLDVVKFLVNHIDINKIQSQDGSSIRNSSEKPSSSIASRSCEECNSLKLASCMCKTRQSGVHVPTTGTISISNSDLSAHDSSVETTALSDLPGNHFTTTRKKHVKTLDKESSASQLSLGCGQQDTSVKQSTLVSKNMSENQNSQLLTSHDNISQNIVPLLKPMDESKEKIKEFNDILHRVCNTSNMQQACVDQRLSNAGTFQDFAIGVIGGDNRNTVPDSSTCENMSIQVPVTKEKNCKGSFSFATTKKSRRNAKKSQIIVVAKLSDNTKQSSEVIDVDAIEEKPKIRSKNEQSKIKILSDVKVDNETLNNNLNAVLQNASSTPLLKMQTVFINGTPVYKPVTNLTKQNYTKDEIMAMPTIIITPVTGPPPATGIGQPRQVTAPSQATHKLPEFVPVPSCFPARSLEPLLIEVSSNTSSSTFTQTAGNLNNLGLNSSADPGLITTVNSSNFDKTSIGTESTKTTDVISASVPKDNVITSATETSTPQALPPTRKSSSTPRRTSHVRVLDFTTPRRILNETIYEVQNSNDAEIVLSKSPNVIVPDANKCSKVVVLGSCGESRKIKPKENNKISPEANKKNWDADLRALVPASSRVPAKKKEPTERKRASKKKKVEEEPKTDDNKKESTKRKSIKSTKFKKTKKNKDNLSEESVKKDVNVNIQNQKVEIPVKPTINIISRHDYMEASHQETEKVQKNSSNDEHDTPEMDRIYLDKEAGGRLNISDLFETPYKQALYDIQMETPRFLGPDLPDDPMSDIKIMNIPTPRFLNSSKGAQATPSSYSSRPTDYSSGGSYYKPDDQDYMPLPENIGCSISPLKDNIENQSPAEVDEEQKQKENKKKTSRPVRQCAKNVTYYNHQINKTKEDNSKGSDDIVAEELISDSSSFQSSPEKKLVKEDTLKKIKEGTPKIRPKTNKGKSSVTKKYKSPVKKEVSKSFMKIRPRRSTPLKNVKGSKKRTSEVREPKSQTRKRTTSRERIIHTAPEASVPTKSRRKSSIPRKLLCTNNSESSGHNSPDLVIKQKENALPRELDLQCPQDSDNEQLKLRWSDDGSQDAKFKGFYENLTNDSEDISKIQEYIKTTVCKPVVSEIEGSLHIDLVKRGFDIETAKIIERDLLDTPPHPKPDNFILKSLENESKKEAPILEKTTESESSTCNNLQIIQDEEADEEEEEIELSVNECNEDSGNYFTYSHDDKVDATKAEPIMIKDKFCMEVCIDDGVSIRLRATPFTMLYEHKSTDDKFNDTQDIEETQRAVSSIKFQTPSKDSIKSRCYEIFDSTLTSLDTPLKGYTPRRPETEVTVTEIVLEVEKVEVKEKTDSKKRKRIQSGNTSDDSPMESKKSKPEAHYMLNSANLQNMDIETVLSKLHGP